jgi:hypothetical protein
MNVKADLFKITYFFYNQFKNIKDFNFLNYKLHLT